MRERLSSMRDYEKTKLLRKTLKSRGIKFTKGYVFDTGVRTDTENITTIWPVDDEPFLSTTFYDDGDALLCEDGLSVEQAIAAAMAVPR